MFTDTTLEVFAYPGIRLRDWDQWRVWIAYVKSIAQVYHVWHLVDPSKSEDEVAEKLMQMPTFDELPQELLDDKATMDPIVWERKYKLYRIQMKVHKFRCKDWERQQTGIMAVHAYIIKHLDRTLIPQLTDDDLSTPHAMLTHLNKRFGRTRAGDLQAIHKWGQMKSVPPAKGADVSKWLNKWDSVRREAIATGIIESEPCHVLLFVDVVRPILPMWAEQKLAEFKVEDSWMTANIDDLMSEFRHMMWATRNYRSSPS